ncbi:hypothetical protein MASR2M39_28260 [Ignavibacteriales bacterium]
MAQLMPDIFLTRNSLLFIILYQGDQKELAEEVDPNAVVLKIYVIEEEYLSKPYNKNIGTEEPNSTEEDPTYFLEEPFEITGEDLIPTSGSYGWFTTPSFQIRRC